MKRRFRYYPDKGFYARWRWYTHYDSWREVVVGPYLTLDAAWQGMVHAGIKL